MGVEMEPWSPPPAQVGTNMTGWTLELCVSEDRFWRLFKSPDWKMSSVFVCAAPLSPVSVGCLSGRVKGRQEQQAASERTRTQRWKR